MIAERVCEYEPCSKTLNGRRAGARFCDTRCRVAAHRTRKRALEAHRAPQAAGGRDGSDVTVAWAPVTVSEPSYDACGGVGCLFCWRHDSNVIAWPAVSTHGARGVLADGVHGAWDEGV